MRRWIIGFILFALIAGCIGCAKEDDAPAGDTLPPAAIQDLGAATGIQAGEIALTWTAPGDDGPAGSACSYVVKTSSTPITPSNFDGATTYTQTWVPVTGGTVENRILEGLAMGQVYYVVVAAFDDAGFASPISNCAAAAAGGAVDTTGPGPVTDLNGETGFSEGEIDLTWTAVGDDGDVGTAAAYVVKISTSPIDAGNFDSATTYAQTWVPLGAGLVENRTLVFLTGGQEYFVAIKVLDEVPHISPISNVESADASTVPDVTPPAAVTDLTAQTSTVVGAVELSWTATGDDGMRGCSSAYILKYDTSPITPATFDSATAVSQNWSPANSGVSEQHTVRDLPLNQTFYFALKVEDEFSNLSGISNVASVFVDGPISYRTWRLGGTGGDSGWGIAVDNAGNIYTAGAFGDSVDFREEWGGGSDVKTAGGFSDIFVNRINADGSYGWTRQIGGTSSDECKGIVADGSGNVTLVGHFRGTVDFRADWGGGSDSLSSAG
ncbi:MAG: SBBP repeat-containing protein, partial [Planctomycetota bacterium]